MSVATFSQDSLKVFSKDDNYSSPVSVGVSSNDQSHGRITWSGDGKWLTVAPVEKGGPLPIFKYSDKQLQPLKYITLSNVTSASFFNWTNRNIAVGSETGEIFVWDIKDKKIGVKVERVESLPVDFIAVNSDDGYLASGSLSSSKICLHGLKTNKVVNTIPIPKSNHTSSLKFCMCKKNFLGASSIESTICVWDILRSEFVFKAVNSHTGACTDISFSPLNYEVIASVSLTKTLKMYDLRLGKLVMDANIGEPMNCVDITPTGDQVAIGTTGGLVIVYDLRTDRIFNSFKAHQDPVLSVKTQTLKIPKTYQEVEMNTPDVVDKKSKTLDISVMDILSPISVNTGKDVSSGNFNQSKTVSFHSTPKFPQNSETTSVYEDSFLKKLHSPVAVPPTVTITPSSQSSPYLCPVRVIQSNERVEPNIPMTIKEEAPSQLSTINGCGDGFHVDDPAERNIYYSDIISEIKNSQKEVLNEISLIKREVTQIRSDFESKFKSLQENYESLNNFVMGEMKNEMNRGNWDSKLEHISHRILLNNLNETIVTSTDKLNEQIELNALRLKHIFKLLNGVE